MDKYLIAEDTKGKTFLEEAFLIKAACSDPAVFRKIYLAYIHPIYRYIYSKVGEVRQAEDLTAQVFLVALESLPRYRRDGHFAAWLFGIARHKVTDYFRSQRSEISIDAIYEASNKKDDPLSTIIKTEEVLQISKLIHQLDEQDQELLRLRLVAELNFAEIAKLLHSNMEATKKKFYRLLTYLRHKLELNHD